MTTSARSPMPGAPGEDHGREQRDEERGERRHGQRPAQLVGLRAERELHHFGAGRECNREQAVVTSQHRCCEVTDRKSTRLNSSHVAISYAVFCLKKKKKK